MNAWGITDIGLVRRENQDTFIIERLASLGDLVAVVCDGMGGAKSGQVASSVAALTFVSEIQKTIRADFDISQAHEAISYCVARANETVYCRSKEDDDCTGMGTTLVAAVTHGKNILICNIGDSRAYRISDSGISRISRDHSVVEKLVENGEITAEEARIHPNRNLITRALGPEETARCDLYDVTLSAGEMLLLCSDGLIAIASDQDIFDTVSSAVDPSDALEALMSLSAQRGAPDNITAVLIGN